MRQPIWLATAAIVIVASLAGCAHVTAFPSLAGAITGDNGALSRLREDAVRLGVVAAAANDAIGQQCSVYTLQAVDAALAVTNLQVTGYVLTDLETARLARPTNVALLWQRANESCAPLYASREGLIGLAASLPRRVFGVFRGRS